MESRASQRLPWPSASRDGLPLLLSANSTRRLRCCYTRLCGALLSRMQECTYLHLELLPLLSPVKRRGYLRRGVVLRHPVVPRLGRVTEQLRGGDLFGRHRRWLRVAILVSVVRTLPEKPLHRPRIAVVPGCLHGVTGQKKVCRGGCALRIDTAYPHTEVAGSLTDSQPKSTAAACSALFISSQYLSFPVTSAVILREEEKEEEKEEEEEEEEEGDDGEEEEARRAPLPSTLFVQTSGYRLSVLHNELPHQLIHIYM